MAKVALPQISSQSFEHEADRAALEALKKTVGFDQLMKGLAKVGVDKVWQVINESSNIRLSEKQVGSIHAIHLECARILDLVGQRLRATTREDDLAFIYFAGHGATETLASGEKRGYLVPSDGSTADPYVSGISMETVRDLSNRLAARHVYYAVDACYSGGLVSEPASVEAFRGVDQNRSVQVLTAGLEGQQAMEEGGRGVFTSYLVEGLKGEADLNGDDFVTASEIGWYVASQVDQATRRRQTPAYGRLDGTGEVSFRLDD